MDPYNRKMLQFTEQFEKLQLHPKEKLHLTAYLYSQGQFVVSKTLVSLGFKL